MFNRLVKRVRRQEGFTLIELIVVVAILGILAAIVTPRVLNALSDAKKGGAEAVGKQIQLAMERYYVDNGNYPTEATVTDAASLVTALKDYINFDATYISNVEYDAESPSETYTLTLEVNEFEAEVKITPQSVKLVGDDESEAGGSGDGSGGQ